MITSLRLQDFKNFVDEELRVGQFTVIVGTNASGKSNIRDAFRLLHGIGKHYTLAELIGGTNGDWQPIRGAGSEIARFGSNEFSIRLGMIVDFAYPRMGTENIENEIPDTGSINDAEYLIRIRRDPDTKKFSVVNEELVIGSDKAFGGKDLDIDNIDRSRPALAQYLHSKKFIEGEKGIYWLTMRSIWEKLVEIRFFDLQPERMREPALPGQKLGDNGENLSAALHEICVLDKRKHIVMEWLRELTPMDVKDIEFRPDPSDRVHLIIVESSGRKVSAYSASDGTLRFLAMLAALFSEDRTQLYFFEEIDNGIHPARLRLLLDLIEQQTARRSIQVVTTTHSTELLSMIDERTFEESTSVVSRLEDTEDAIIRSVSDLPEAKRLRESQGLGRLFSSGWIEDALDFTGGRVEESDV